MRGVLILPKEATARQIRRFASDGYNAVVLHLRDEASEQENQNAAQQVLKSGLGLYYWIEVGRNATLAKAHPEWMASLQTHPEWRRHFPKFAQPATNQVVKNYPWVPVLYKETFDVHRERVEVLLEDLPRAQGIFLNHLQGAPSACGCGNHFCRWTADYGPIKTATPLPEDAAAKFVVEVEKLMPGANVIPVWTTECAEHDGPKGAACDGVGCFKGACWKEYTAQLMPLARVSERIGVLLPLRDFPAPLSRTGHHGEWQEYALKSFGEIVPARGGQAIPANRLIAILQGWDASRAQQQTQIRRSEQAGVGGYILALAKLDQSWEPRLFTLP